MGKLFPAVALPRVPLLDSGVFSELSCPLGQGARIKDETSKKVMGASRRKVVAAAAEYRSAAMVMKMAMMDWSRNRDTIICSAENTQQE